MKISAIETILLQIPMASDGVLPHVSSSSRPTMGVLQVRVVTDDGIVGWGEAFGHAVSPATKATIDTLLTPGYIGRDASAITALNAEMRRRHHVFGYNGSVLYGISAIDIALWDIAGKVAGLPLYRLLGGTSKSDLPTYASLLRYEDPRKVTFAVSTALLQGYESIKLHEINIPEVKAARDVAGRYLPLMLDVNCPWSLREATVMVERLKPFDLHWLEEPIYPPDDPEGMAAVRRLGMPVAAGENVGSPFAFRHLFEAKALDFAQPSVTKIGGITGMLEIISLAAAHNVPVVPHCAYLGSGFLATLHLVAAMPAETLMERLYVDLDAELFGDLGRPVRGRMGIPQGPGLGCDPDPEVIARYRIDGPTRVG